MMDNEMAIDRLSRQNMTLVMGMGAAAAAMTREKRYGRKLIRAMRRLLLGADQLCCCAVAASSIQQHQQRKTIDN